MNTDKRRSGKGVAALVPSAGEPATPATDEAHADFGTELAIHAPAVAEAMAGRQDEYAQRVVGFHVAAQQHGSCAVYCAAAAGAVMLQKKKVTPHGRFSKWLRCLVLPDGREIAWQTAHNYMALARQIAERIKALPKIQSVGFLPESSGKHGHSQKSYIDLLAEFDPTKTHELRNQAMAEAVREIAGERTLTQLYFDWEIFRPRKTGYQKYTPPKPMTAEEKIGLERDAASTTWNRIGAELEEQGIRQHSWSLLSDAERQGLVSILEELIKKVRKTLAR